VGCFFVAALFCDQINLDDLICGCVVLHGEAEVPATVPGLCDGPSVAGCWHRGFSPDALGVRQPVAPSRATIRVIIDQDSPSLPAISSRIVGNVIPFLEDSSAVSFDDELAKEKLYLQSCSLLI
jgi:hypothetical protein